MEVCWPALFGGSLTRHGNAIALIDGITGRKWTYAELSGRIEREAQRFSTTEKGLVFLPLNNTIEDIGRYLAALTSGHAIYPYSSQTSLVGLRNLIEKYEPEFVAGSATTLTEDLRYSAPAQDGYGHPYVRRTVPSHHGPIHPFLTLLLSTSGSTGSGKMARLSDSNIRINASQICEALSIDSEDRAVTSLPLSYVYGLSVLHSHLTVGASIVVEARSVMEKEFWATVRENTVTSFAGVPWTYRMLKTNGMSKMALPSLKTLSTSGGKMDELTMDWLESCFLDKGVRVYYMYGQTEASGRITVLPPEMAKSKRNSVGKPVRQGTIRCADDGTVIYSGPNVMLGYAKSVHDLRLGDELNQMLDTGDLGYVDSDGYLYLTGRKNRVCKIYGVRINLDEIQAYLHDKGLGVSVREGEPDTLLIRHSDADAEVHNQARNLASFLGIPKTAIRIQKVAELPRQPSGKLDILND